MDCNSAITVAAGVGRTGTAMRGPPAAHTVLPRAFVSKISIFPQDKCTTEKLCHNSSCIQL